MNKDYQHISVLSGFGPNYQHQGLWDIKKSYESAATRCYECKGGFSKYGEFILNEGLANVVFHLDLFNDGNLIEMHYDIPDHLEPGIYQAFPDHLEHKVYMPEDGSSYKAVDYHALDRSLLNATRTISAKHAISKFRKKPKVVLRMKM